MGLADRDYMRERRRRDLNELMADTDRPFMPSRGGASLFVILAFWMFVAGALYGGYKWFQSKPSDRPVRGESMRSLESPPARDAARQAPPAKATAAGDDRSLASPTPNHVVRREPPLAPPEAMTTNPQVSTTGSTIYLCKAYSGGTFWSQVHCGQQQALIDSIASVPAGIPFDQQVVLAQQHRRELAQTVYAAPAPMHGSQAAVSNKGECQALDRRVDELDAMARQPQSPGTQDWIAGERRKARDRQFAIRC